MSKVRITKRAVDALRPGETIFDTEVVGLGARCQKSKTVYFLKSIVKGQQQWLTIGKHGSPFTAEMARNEALKLLGTIAQGGDPAQAKRDEKAAQTVGELCDMYFKDALAGRILTRAGVPKRPSTLATDVGRAERHIKPLLGRKKVKDLTKVDVRRFMNDIVAGKTKAVVVTKKRGKAIVDGGWGTATRTVGLLGAILQYGVRNGLRADNPAHGVERRRDRVRDRYLTPEEYRALGKALRFAEISGANQKGLTVIRLLALTGCRKNEIQTLHWSYIDFPRSCLRLPATKTGKSIRPLGQVVLGLLQTLPRYNNTDAILPGDRGPHYDGTPKIMNLVRDTAKLDDRDEEGRFNVTLHTLRHSFATMANELGFTEATIASMLGHRLGTITSRYIHHLDSSLVAAATKVSQHIADLLQAGADEADAEYHQIQKAA
ncbi:tyrosine-type recombinase/integrase [Ferrovibrio sp.]|uniref:tyrosine-type recombinase/integrase n=1 Tax=Ferrovibrio sp. TaxID=1917215 RepID=UPI0025C37AE7|nr:tyrosine-type recombinase/integrase [Ferrovibrio sp.]